MLYISSRWSVDRVLGLMQQCDVILAEAMHGAIVADALRIPWIPISCSRIILEFKWQDWLSSLNLSYEAHPVTPLISVEWASAATQGSWLKRGVKRALSSIGVWSRDWGDRPEAPSKPETVSVASSDLRAAARSRPVLSDISILQRRACQFDAVLEPLIEQKIRGK